MSTPATPSAPLMLSVSGLRGIVGESLTPDVISAYLGAVVTWMRDKTSSAAPIVVLACDGRRAGPALKDLAGATLAAAGCRVVDIGSATTPTLGVMVTHLRAHAGITLTASHNPGQWNGIKVIDASGAAPDPASARDIVDRFNRRERGFAAPQRFGAVERDPSAAAVHVERVLAALALIADVEAIRRRRFAVVVDSVNASGAPAARLLLERLGCRIVHLHDQTTGDFPHPPEPTEGNLRDLGAQVTANHADVGFAQDPDADRLALIDERGSYIGEEYTLVFAARALLEAPGTAPKGAALAVNLSTSRMIDDVAERLGAVVHRAPVGEANVVHAMRQHHALLGGEGNGGVIWPPVTLIRDSIGAMALTLALMQRNDATLSALVGAQPTYAIEKRKVDLTQGLADKALEAARRVAPDARFDTQDGLRADFAAPSGKGRAWLHVRASNTEPILRLIAEAPTRQDAAAILDKAQALIAQL